MCGAGQCWAGGPLPMQVSTASRPAPPAPATQAGLTPLHRAAGNGHKDVAALLLERGANKEAKDKVSGPRVGVGRGWVESGRPGNKRGFTHLASVGQRVFHTSVRGPHKCV